METESYDRVTYSERFGAWIPEQWVTAIDVHPADGFSIDYTDTAGCRARRRFIGYTVREAVAVLAGERVTG